MTKSHRKIAPEATISIMRIAKPRQSIFVCLILSVIALPLSAERDPVVSEQPFTIAELLGSTAVLKPRHMSAFTPPSAALATQGRFQGRLKLTHNFSGIEVLLDRDGVSSDVDLKLSRFPEVALNFTILEGHITPEIEIPRRTTHPYWELVFRPGQTWVDTNEPGWQRAVLPFALKERNQNCVHHGVLIWAFQESGEITSAAWQVSSEVCAYLKVNLWGKLKTGLKLDRIEENASIDEINGKQHGLVTKTIESIAKDFPGISIDEFQPPDPDNTSIFGYIINGIHYRSTCPTRHGNYPFCDQLVLPSYSLAKSLSAGLHYMYLVRQWPEFASRTVADLIPQCAMDDQRWSDVTMHHLVNMTTGNFNSSVFGEDEYSPDMMGFFLAQTHSQKVLFSCNVYSRRAVPGSKIVYHTTDDYLLGVAMQAFVQQKFGAQFDLHRDSLYPQILAPLGVSRLLEWTQRTYDDTAMPFVSYGMMMLPDDLARISQFLIQLDESQSLFEPSGLEQALFRSDDPYPHFPDRRESYRFGFWGYNYAQRLGCTGSAWNAFMSGYAGIHVSLMPNNTIYYYFADGDVHGVGNALEASHRIRSLCRP